MKLMYLTFILAQVFTLATSVSVMSIDLGSEWMKVAIVSPGVPMEIALNRDSQRKTPVAVGFRDGERTFGDAALNMGVRFPSKSYVYFLDLLGKKIDNPIVDAFVKKFPHYKLEKNKDSDSFSFKHPEDELFFSPEELLAMVLRHGQDIASNAAGSPIKDAVITVPAFFTQAERRALLRAAELAKINVLQLLNSNTAAALNYGVFRRKDFNETQPQTIMFFDMGAGSTVASIASFQLTKSKERGFVETHPQLTIKGIGFDRDLGGLDIQLRLRDHLAKVFKEQGKTKSSIKDNPRAMAKLFKEAGRVKKVLSANTDHIAQVENLIDDKDFRTMVTRADLEDLIKDYPERIQNVVQMALKSAGISIEDIDQVVLAGSGTRVPMIQQALLKTTGKSELAKSLNTDEAAVLGAAYQAAYLSKGFKVKTFLIRDFNLYPIQVEFQREVEKENNEGSFLKNFKRTLFQHGNPIPQKKIMTFRSHSKDFDIYLNYGEMDFLPPNYEKTFGSFNISKISISGINDAIKKYTDIENTESKGVKAYFRLNENGLLNFEHAEALFERKIEETSYESTIAKLGNTIGQLFSRGEEEPGPEKTDSPETNKSSTESLPKDETETKRDQDQKTQDANHSSQAEASNHTDPQASGEKEPKIETLKEHLRDDINILDFKGPSIEEIEILKIKLDTFDKKDAEKFEREHAKNALESFILEMREKLYTPEYEEAITPEEKEKLLQKISEASEWLEYESDNSPTKEFKDKQKELSSSSKELLVRVWEHSQRPEALKSLDDLINISSTFLEKARELEDSGFTEVELSTLEKLIEETKEWKTSHEAEQALLPRHENPILTIKDIGEKIANLDREVKYLLNKARTTPKKKEPTSSESPSPQEDLEKEAEAEVDASLPEPKDVESEESIQKDSDEKPSQTIHENDRSEL